MLEYGIEMREGRREGEGKGGAAPYEMYVVKTSGKYFVERSCFDSVRVACPFECE